MNKLNLQMFAVDAKTIKNADLAKVRDVDFAERFNAGIETLMQMLGVTRKIEKKAGEVLKAYKVTGTLESGAVSEGEVIPLSKYQTTYNTIGEATLKKWRKVTTAEAISEKGYGQAVNDTNGRISSTSWPLVPARRPASACRRRWPRFGGRCRCSLRTPALRPCIS